MSWIDSGRRRTRLEKAKNSETERVQKRIDSVLDPLRSRIANSLSVESTPAVVFRRTKVGLPCSCTKIEKDDIHDVEGAVEHSDLNQLRIKPVGNGGMFGGGGGLTSFEGTEKGSGTSNILDLADLSSEDMYDPTITAGNNANCGICYNQGFVPSFQAVNWHVITLTHHHAQDLSGYEFNTSNQPLTMERVSDDAVAVFKAVVPKWFKTAQYSVRNNGKLLPADTRVFALDKSTLVPITKAFLDKNKGQEISIAVCAECFTHIVLMFDLGLNPLLVNLSEEQNVLNYDQELTVGDLTLIMTSNVGNIQSEDIVVLPEKNYVILVNSAPKRRTAKGDTWEWSVTGRPAQKKEYMYNMLKGYKIY